MLLSRIAGHLKEQNWIAVVIDFLIVVVGVFVAMQVNNWNETRKERLQSEIFSQRLIQDLQEEAWNFQFLIEYYQDVRDNTQRTIAELEHRQNLDDEQFLIAAYRATQYSLDTRRRSTFDELTSTGNLYLIRDADLRETALRVYNFPVFQTIRQAAQQSRYREQFRMKIPTVVQQALLGSCGDRYVEINDYQGIIDSLDYPCQLTVDEELIAESVRIIKSDPRLVEMLRLRYSELTSNLSSLTVFYPEVRESLRRYSVRGKPATVQAQTGESDE